MRPGVEGYAPFSSGIRLGVEETLNSSLYAVTRKRVAETVLFERRFLALGLHGNGPEQFWKARAPEAGVLGPHFTDRELGKHRRTPQSELVCDSLCIGARELERDDG